MPRVNPIYPKDLDLSSGEFPESPSKMMMKYTNLLLTAATRKLFPTLILAVCMFFVAQTAKADNFVFSINNFGQGPNLGTVTTTLSGGSILVSVNLNPLYVIHGQGVGFNVAPGFAGISITSINSATIFSQDLTAQNYDGLGNFAYSVASNQSTAQARTSLTQVVTFTVNTTTIGGFTNANQLVQFAAQVAPLDTSAATGFAATTSDVVINPNSTVPEPASMFLLGSGLVGAAASIRRRRAKR